MPRSRPRKVRRMTAPGVITQRKPSQRPRSRKMADDDPPPDPAENPFSFTSFLENGSQVPEVQRSKNNKNARDRYSYQDSSQSNFTDIFADVDADENEELLDEVGNPFSFKEFVKKEKRDGIYLSDEEDAMGEDMGNQSGSTPAPGPSQQSSGTAVDGRPNQRRATSPGLPSRSKHKPHSKAAPPAAGVDIPPATPQKGRKGQSKNQEVLATSQNEGDFVDFIYNYATQDGEEGGMATPTHQRRAKNGTARHSFGDTDAPPVPDKKVYARERARAHTHGHAIRKNKAGPPKPHPKSQLVVDYIDATGDDASMFPPGNEQSVLDEVTARPKANADVKPHRERARAQSHGHRKHKAGDKGNKNKNPVGEEPPETKQGNGKTSPMLVVENGNVQQKERRPSPSRRQDNVYDDLRRNLATRNHSQENLDEPYDTIPIRNRSPSPAGTPPTPSSPIEDDQCPSDSSPDRLGQENARLRRELAEARKNKDKDSKRIETMEVELKRLRLREAEDAKTLEAMVQHVEANLKRTTERAVSAETTITNLKKEVKLLKTDNTTLLAEVKKYQQGKDVSELKERAHTASLKLAGAAKDAEANLKQLMSGVDVLKLMAQTLACFDKVSEQTEGRDGQKDRKGFATAL